MCMYMYIYIYITIQVYIYIYICTWRLLEVHAAQGLAGTQHLAGGSP